MALRRAAGHLERRLRARRHLEPVDWSPRAREGGPSRAQRGREPDERGGVAGRARRRRRLLRGRRHQWHDEGGHRCAPGGEVRRERPRGCQRRARRLLGLPPGV